MWLQHAAREPALRRIRLAHEDAGQAARVSNFGGDTPMQRPAQPEEIAPAYVFLAAPSCSSYITGEILPIIGGYSGG